MWGVLEACRAWRDGRTHVAVMCSAAAWVGAVWRSVPSLRARVGDIPFGMDPEGVVWVSPGLCS